ncbi:MAG: regulatory protein RecX [Eggerthellaceae bacterium]|nr:regulatory protein RecX [Eggerthellaceae bacterium]
MKLISNKDDINRLIVNNDNHDHLIPDGRDSFVSDKPESTLDSYSKAKQSLYRMIALREHSEAQLRDKLKAKKYDEDVIDCVIKQAKKDFLIDDSRYAEAYVFSKLCGGFGLSGIRSHLSDTGLDSFAIESVIFDACNHLDIPYDDETQRALSVLNISSFQSKNIHDAAFRKLVRMGYDIGCASAAVNIWISSYLTD